MKKEMQKLERELVRQGFETSWSKKRHLRVYLDGVWLTTFGGTPSDHRSWRNSMAPLKRAGFRWPP